MAEHNGAVVWVVLLDEDVTIEAAQTLYFSSKKFINQ